MDCKKMYLVTSSATWVSGDSDFATRHHGLLKECKKNLNHNSIVSEGSEISATHENGVADMSNLLDLNIVSSNGNSSGIASRLQGRSRKRRVSAISGEWYRLACQHGVQWVDNSPAKNRSKKASKQKTSIDITHLPDERVSKKIKKDLTSKDSELNPTDDRQHKCDTCGKCFTNKFTLGRHHQSFHLDERPYKCDTCSKSFVDKHTLGRHQSFHSDERPYKCETCGNSFQTKGGVQRHMKIHTGETPFKCSYCDKAFPLRDRCMQHEATHDQTRRHACEKCESSFARASDLNRHKKFVHSLAGYPFTCELCGSGLTSELNYRDHLNYHTGATPSECDVCHKKLKTKARLKEHKRTHLPYTERPFKCEFCTSRFWEKRKLRHHLKVHATPKPHNVVQVHPPNATGSKVFICKVCKTEFNDKKELMIHRQQQYCCQLCASVFVCEGDLLRHNANVHNVPKPPKVVQVHPPNTPSSKVFMCEICNRKFADKKEREIHCKQQYCCQLCASVYECEVDLLRHNTDVHDVQVQRT